MPPQYLHRSLNALAALKWPSWSGAPHISFVVSSHSRQAYVSNYGTENPARPILLTNTTHYGQPLLPAAPYRVVGQ